MPTKTSICKLVNDVQVEYLKLFDDLVLLKNFKSKKFSTKIVLEFQYRLASTLFKLANARNEIVSKEKCIILRKESVSKKWFVDKMKLYKTLKNGIDNSISIGKSLGDAFVWHFYQLNPKEFFSQLEYPEIKVFPTGIGGIGELKFIKTYPILKDHFVILHGITNFLRVGDVSMFSLKDGRLSCIGEIKTKEVEKNKINISLTALNAKGRDFLQSESIKVNEPFKYTEYFDPQRFKRQIDKTAAFLKSKHAKDKVFDKVIYDKYYVSELEQVVEGLKRKDVNVKQVSESILYTAVKLSSKKASTKIFEKYDASKLHKYESSIQKDVTSILRTDTPNYPMRYGSVHFDSNYITQLTIGVPPLFWYPIKPTVLRKIYFQHIFIMTMFNPTNFYLSLNELGIEILKDDTKKNYYLGKKLSNGGILKFQHFSYFLTLIENNLHTPEAVIDMIKEMITQVEGHKDKSNSIKLEIEILHLFKHYNQDNV